MLKNVAFLIVLWICSIECWEALPQIPSGRRSQYLVLHENGNYKYGYDTGDGSAAEQSGDAANQVQGRYLYDSPSGQKFSIRYTAGIQGFVPEGLPTVSPSIPEVSSSRQYLTPENGNDDQSGTGDASYSFNVDTDTYRRQETSDSSGNIKGSYSYNNEAGTHDLSYTAGENTGFVALSGSLATPNGLKDSLISSSSGYTYNPSTPDVPRQDDGSAPNSDGSYSFGYSTPDASQQQSGDANGNVRGSFSYKTSAGTHDLTYIAGSDTGFVATGGSLSQPNGLGSQIFYAKTNPQVTGVSSQSVPSISSPLTDGSYSFDYSTDDSARRETSDANGNVQGSYSYRNQAGDHDLSYVAGSSTGFQVTGGSLSVPNGLGNNNPILKYNIPETPSPVDTYTSSESDLANTGDASYSFTIDTDDYKRTETSDASGNVQGSYVYRNSAGTHDLSFVAGSATGFLPTGGSLYSLNGIPSTPGLNSRSFINSPSITQNHEISNENTDASYNFAFDTGEYKRTESSDASGNVIGSFSYKNSVGGHDLSYEAGAEKGFRAIGGSLSNAPGLTDLQLRSGGFGPQISSAKESAVTNHILPSGKNTYRVGNLVVNSYLPPSNEKKKFGYIFDTKY